MFTVYHGVQGCTKFADRAACAAGVEKMLYCGLTNILITRDCATVSTIQSDPGRSFRLNNPDLTTEQKKHYATIVFRVAVFS